ncbi:winged helix-turn-helix domain-containing protein [Streptomyces sp. MUSC 125]|uniref:winged helix-turn-helix domain-containing protein n=1 Tax=Streptomyces sp. MUSC 125 TaxID=1428624 RepID=UPI00068B7C8F|nr:winged helix-turn-helix domain-containing protein [Streptomyces sp. MUSC 125]
MTLPLEEDPRPPFVQAAEVLRNAITDGEFAPGEKLPSARVLQERFGIASSTVHNALRVLKGEGLVYSVMGRGSYVRDWINEPATDAPAAREAGESASRIDPEDPRPPYVKVAEALRAQIHSGELPPGQKLPTARELQQIFGIASATAQNALRVLKDEGLIYSVHGRGVFVRKLPPAQDAALRWDRANELAMARREEDRKAVEATGKTDEEAAAELKQARAELAAARANLDAINRRVNALVEDQKRRARLRGETHPEETAKRAAELRAALNRRGNRPTQ